MAQQQGSEAYKALEKIKRYIAVGETPAAMVAEYDGQAVVYDDNMVSIGYIIPREVSGRLIQHIRSLGSETKVVDIACGTGLAGTALREKGFKGVLHGIDGSEKMVSKARAKGCYDELIVQIMRAEKKIETPTKYDGLTCVGGFTFNHLNANILGRLVDLMAEGGVMVFSCRDSVDNRDLLDQLRLEVASFVTSGSIEEISREESSHGVNWNAGDGTEEISKLEIFVLRKL